MTTVPEKGTLKGFRGFNMNRHPDVIPTQSAKDFTASIEALKKQILHSNDEVDEILNDLLNHITNFNNPHLLNFSVFYTKLREEIYSLYISYFVTSTNENPLSIKDFYTAISTNPLGLFELIRLINTNNNKKEKNPSNNIDISDHGKATTVSVPIYSYSPVVSGSNDYPYYNNISFLNSTQTLPEGYTSYIKNLKPVLMTLEVPAVASSMDTVINKVIINDAQKTSLEGTRETTKTLKSLSKNNVFASFPGVETWGENLAKIFSDSSINDSGQFNKETLFVSFRVALNDLEKIGESNPFPYLIHMFSSGEGFIVTVDYNNGQKEIIVRQFITLNNNLYLIDDSPLIIPVKEYTLAIKLSEDTVDFIAGPNGSSNSYFQYYRREKQFNSFYNPIDTNRFILTNIRLKRDDTYIYDYINTDTNSGFTDNNQKQTVFINYLEVHSGYLPDDYIEDKLSSNL